MGISIATPTMKAWSTTPTSSSEKQAELDEYIPEGKGRRLLETYDPIVLPVEKDVRILTTATDVIHSSTIPAFGVKKDAVPGRTNETWVRISEPARPMF